MTPPLITVKLRGPTGPFIECDALPTNTPGIVITEFEGAEPGCYRLTHASSGLCLTPFTTHDVFGLLRLAMALAVIDWTKDAATVLKSGKAAGVGKIIAEFEINRLDGFGRTAWISPDDPYLVSVGVATP